jgi:hypothetical protein
MAFPRKLFSSACKKRSSDRWGKKSLIRALALAMFKHYLSGFQASSRARGTRSGREPGCQRRASVVPQSTENKSGYCAPADRGDFPGEAREVR